MKRNNITGSYSSSCVKKKVLKRKPFITLKMIEREEMKRKKQYLNRKYYIKNQERLKHKRWLQLKGEAQILNEKFELSDAHHVNEHYIVYIPRYIHRSVWHSLVTGKGIVEINKKVFKWLRTEKNQELEDRLKAILPEYMFPHTF